MSTYVIPNEGTEQWQGVRQVIKFGKIQAAATRDLISDVTLVIESDVAAQFTH